MYIKCQLDAACSKTSQMETRSSQSCSDKIHHPPGGQLMQAKALCSSDFGSWPYTVNTSFMQRERERETERMSEWESERMSEWESERAIVIMRLLSAHALDLNAGETEQSRLMFWIPWYSLLKLYCAMILKWAVCTTRTLSYIDTQAGAKPTHPRSL